MNSKFKSLPGGFEHARDKAPTGRCVQCPEEAVDKCLHAREQPSVDGISHIRYRNRSPLFHRPRRIRNAAPARPAAGYQQPARTQQATTSFLTRRI